MIVTTSEDGKSRLKKFDIFTNHHVLLEMKKNDNELAKFSKI